MAAEMDLNGTGNCCYLCNQCASSFASLSDLEVHMKSHVGEERRGEEHSPSSSDGSFPMEEDMGTTDTNSQLEIVAKGDEEDSMDGPESPLPPLKGKVFPCRFCAKLFQSRSLLNIHYTHTHRDKPQYECEDCGQIFSVKRELATHRRIHAGEQTHACAQCGKEFGTRQLLKKHWMWHTGQRSHVCPHCGKAFFQKGHLTQHLMIHAGGRPHVCELCNKTFIFKFDLNRHMKIHAERGYSCSKCGKCFLKQATLVDHQGRCKGPDGTPKKPASRPQSVDSSGLTQTTPSPVQSSEPSSVHPSPNSGNPFFPSFSPNGLPGQQQQPQRFMCLLCMQEFPSQAAYSLHLSYTHFRDGIFSPLSGNNPAASQAAIISAAARLAEVKNGNITSGLDAIAASLSEVPKVSRDSESLFSPSTAKSTTSVITTASSNSLQSSNTVDDSSNPTGSSARNQSGGHFKNDNDDISIHGPESADSQHQSLTPRSSPKTSPSMQFMDTINAAKSFFSGAESSIKAEEEDGEEKQKSEEGTQNGCDTESTAQEDPDLEPMESNPDCATCHSAQGQLLGALRRLSELEKTIATRDSEIRRLREKMKGVGLVAGSLLESCSEFDKLWMLHSKKVYSQIQSVLNSLD